MLIRKGQRLIIRHTQYGTFRGEASRDFNTESLILYPIITLEPMSIRITDWSPGEEIPCRGSLCEIEIIEE